MKTKKNKFKPRKYILRKDLNNAKAGTEFVLGWTTNPHKNNQKELMYLWKVNGVQYQTPRNEVEGNTEWFFTEPEPTPDIATFKPGIGAFEEVLESAKDIENSIDLDHNPEDLNLKFVSILEKMTLLTQSLNEQLVALKLENESLKQRLELCIESQRRN